MTDRGRRILIDGTMIKGGGGFTHLVNVLPTLAGLAPEHHFMVVTADERVFESIPRARNLEVQYTGALGTWGRLDFTYRKAARLAAGWGADLYFSAGEMVPLNAPCPTIASFRNPNVFTWFQGQRWPRGQQARLWMLYAASLASARRADRVMFVSHDSARWIGDGLRVPESKRRVVHHGIDLKTWTPRDPTQGTGNFILSVSSIYPYKNFVRLIEGYGELVRRRPEAPDLVIVGDEQDAETARRMEAAREASGTSESIHILGTVPYAEVPKYYQSADLFVFPSWLETFGHPLLEAMATEVPLVAADLPVFREIAGDAAFYADPYDSLALANAMENALYLPGATHQLTKRGRQRVRDLTWEHSAERLLTLFEELL